MKGEISLTFSHKGLNKEDYEMLIEIYDSTQKQSLTIDKNLLVEGRFSRWKQ